jgi:hypothetical protein
MRGSGGAGGRAGVSFRVPGDSRLRGPRARWPPPDPRTFQTQSPIIPVPHHTHARCSCPQSPCRGPAAPLGPPAAPCVPRRERWSHPLPVRGPAGVCARLVPRSDAETSRPAAPRQTTPRPPAAFPRTATGRRIRRGPGRAAARRRHSARRRRAARAGRRQAATPLAAGARRARYGGSRVVRMSAAAPRAYALACRLPVTAVSPRSTPCAHSAHPLPPPPHPLPNRRGQGVDRQGRRRPDRARGARRDRRDARPAAGRRHAGPARDGPAQAGL